MLRIEDDGTCVAMLFFSNLLVSQDREIDTTSAHYLTIHSVEIISTANESVLLSNSMEEYKRKSRSRIRK